MLIEKSFETEQGTVKFQGELEQEELDYVLQIGLNYLLQHGAISVSVVSAGADAHQPPENLQ